MNRYLFVGSIDYSAHCLRELLNMNINIVDIMCPYEEASKFNNDYCDLGKVAKEFHRNVYYFKEIRDESEHIREINPDLIFVLGLSQIVPKHILEIPKIGCIGSHAALLPKNRGRHPVIWAIANGLKKSGMTLLWLDEGVDSGDIWAQKKFDINETDDASTIYQRVKELTIELLRENIPDLENGIAKRVKQDESLASYWRKRTKKDGEIDWRMSSRRIYDLVRALFRPYAGAHCFYQEKEIKIWKVKILDANKKLNNLEPGRVLYRTDFSIQVKTGDSAIEIVEHEFNPLPQVGEYL